MTAISVFYPRLGTWGIGQNTVRLSQEACTVMKPKDTIKTSQFTIPQIRWKLTSVDLSETYLRSDQTVIPEGDPH